MRFLVNHNGWPKARRTAAWSAGRRLACAAAAILLATACVPAQSGDPNQRADPGTEFSRLESHTLTTGVVVHPALGLVYIMRPAGGVEALDMADGATRWVSTRVEQALFVSSGVLVARRKPGVSGIVVERLDPSNGRPIDAHSPNHLVALPDGVTAVIDQTLAQTFRYSVKEIGGRIFLTWEYIERDVTGVSPPGGRAFARREQGAFRVQGGKFEPLPPDAIPAAAADWPPALKTQYEAQGLRGPVWQSGDVLATAQQQFQPDRLLLKRWRRDTGESLEDKLLHEGRAIAVLAACDERRVALAVSGDGASASRAYRLLYHAVESGELVTERHSARSVTPFCLFGSQLLSLSQPGLHRVDGVLVEQPYELVARDIESGEEAWRRVLRDTTFRQAPPPGR